jgi:hypothetical protein
VKFPYLIDHAKVPQPSLGGGVERPRPVIAVRLAGPTGSRILDGHLDTAADDTIFPLWVSTLIGLDLSVAAEQDIHLAGRGQPYRARFLPVELHLSDGRESCWWRAMVGFVSVPLRRALLGQAGFLQFFDSDFRGADREVILTPNRSFTGQKI